MSDSPAGTDSPTSPRGPSTRTLLVLVAAVVVALAVAVFFIQHSTSDGDSSAGAPQRAATPKGALEVLATAVEDGDCKTLKRVWPAEHEGSCDDILADYDTVESVDVASSEVTSENGDVATIEADVVFVGTGADGQDVTVRQAGTYTLGKVDGAWQITRFRPQDG